MGFFDTLSDLIEAATPWSQVEAEAPAKEEETTVCIFLLAIGIAEGMACQWIGAGEYWSFPRSWESGDQRRRVGNEDGLLGRCRVEASFGWEVEELGKGNLKADANSFE